MKISRHILSWLLVILLLTLVFSHSFSSRNIALYFVSMLLPVIAGTYYFLDRYLIPEYLVKEKYLKFFLFLFYTIVVSLYLEMMVMLVTFIFFVNFNLGRMEPYASDAVILAVIMYLIVFAGLFISAFTNLRGKDRLVVTLEDEIRLKERGFLKIRAQRKSAKIYYDQILFIESLSDYVKFHLENENTVTSREKISHIEKQLPSDFLRCHRSFIVHTSRVTTFSSEFVSLGKTEIPVGRSYRKTVREALTE
jgi:two-component system response regulator LytT